MAADATTIARPYAVAAFERAVATDKLDLWSDMLELLASAARDPALAGLIASPKLTQAQMTELMLDVHHKGRAVVASCGREEAEMHVFRLHEHGLWATMEHDGPGE